MLSEATESPAGMNLDAELECGARQTWGEQVEEAFPFTQCGEVEGDPVTYAIKVAVVQTQCSSLYDKLSLATLGAFYKVKQE